MTDGMGVKSRPKVRCDAGGCNVRTQSRPSDDLPSAVAVSASDASVPMGNGSQTVARLRRDEDDSKISR